MSRVAKSVLVVPIVIVLSIFPYKLAIGQSFSNGGIRVNPILMGEAPTESPSPVTIQFAGLLFIPEDQTYEIQLSINSPDLVKYIKISVWDTKGGMKIAEYTFDNPGNFNTFTIPTDAFTAGRDYQLRIIAVSRADNTPFTISLDNSGDPVTELIHNFSFDPSIILPKIEIESVVQQGNDLLVNISATNSQLIGGYDGWLVDESTNTQVLNSNFTSPSMLTGVGTILIPMEKNRVPNGKYTVVVRVLGKNSQVYASAQYPSIVYKATHPTVFQTIATALRASPNITISIIAIVLVVVGFLMYNNMREKSMTGTPVMQRRLGAKLNKRMGESILPIANEEPIPSSNKSRIPALIILHSTNDTSISGKKFTLSQFPFTIGRSNCTLTIHDDCISRVHAQITYDSKTRSYFITDMKSSNGTRINGIVLAGGRPHRLESGVVVTFGPNIEARFEYN